MLTDAQLIAVLQAVFAAGRSGYPPNRANQIVAKLVAAAQLLTNTTVTVTRDDKAGWVIMVNHG